MWLRQPKRSEPKSKHIRHRLGSGRRAVHSLELAAIFKRVFHEFSRISASGGPFLACKNGAGHFKKKTKIKKVGWICLRRVEKFTFLRFGTKTTKFGPKMTKSVKMTQNDIVGTFSVSLVACESCRDRIDGNDTQREEVSYIFYPQGTTDLKLDGQKWGGALNNKTKQI